MRPIPARKHHWAVAVLVGVVAANTALTCRQSQVTDDQANMLAEVLKTDDPLLYPSDDVFSDSGRGAAWRLRLPAWRALLSAGLSFARPGQPLDAFRLVGAAALLVYLIVMYVLLYRQAHSPSVATLVAVMSTAIFSTRRPYWGMGPLFAVSPASVYLALTPLLVLLFVNSRRSWAVVGAFFLAGVVGNVHLSSAANLVAVLLIALLATGRGRPRAWALAAAGGAAAAIGAAPALHHYLTAFRAAGVAWPEITMPALRGVLRLAGVNVLYPGVLIEWLRWLPVAVGLAAPAAVILSRTGRYRLRDLPCWFWLLAAALLVAFGLHGLAQVAGKLLGGRPPVIELFGALRLAMLPLYVLFAQAMVHLVRLARTHRAWVRAVVTVAAVIYLGFSYNTRPIRHTVQDLIAAVAQDPTPTPRSARAEADAELLAIARWAGQDDHTPPDALFLTEHAEVRMYGRRSLLCCPADVHYLYHLRPAALPEWAGRLRDQRAFLAPPGGARTDAKALVAFIDAQWQRKGRLPAPTYVLMSRDAVPAGDGDGRITEIAPPADLWGRHRRLLRVLPFRPTRPATPAPTASPPDDPDAGPAGRSEPDPLHGKEPT